MATKTSHRRAKTRRVRMLEAAVRRAERKGNGSDTLWAAVQLELAGGKKVGDSK